MPQGDRDVTFQEVLRINERAEIRATVETDGAFNLIYLRVWSYEDGCWKATSNCVRVKAQQLPDFIRLALRAHQSIQRREAR